MNEFLTILRCKNCGGGLLSNEGKYTCGDCFETYQIEEGVIIMGEGVHVDLRSGNKLLDLHKLCSQRVYFDRIIKSDVEFAGRVYSVKFPEFHAELLSPHLDGKVIADLGCGQLPYINAFSSAGVKEYYAFDLSRESLNIAWANYHGQFPLYLVQCDVTKVPLPANSIDAIMSSEVIEHLNCPLEYLSEIHRICNYGGYLSISTPCISMYLYPHNFFHLLINPRSIRQWWRKLNSHKHWAEALSWHPALRPRILRSWLEKTGFKVIRHETRLSYYGSPLQFAWRFFGAMELAGFKSAGTFFNHYLKMTDRLIATRLSLFRWAGIRQFVLCQKL